MHCPSADTIVVYLRAPATATLRHDIDAHIDRCPSCRELLAVLADSGHHPRTARRRPPSQTAVPAGTSLGRYVLRDVLGAGAMGIVYRAYDPRLDRDVALKLLRPIDRGHDATDALLREARAMAQVRHVGVVEVFDVGRFDGRVYMAMERIDSVTLRAWAHRTRPSWREAVTASIQAGEGLAAAHRAGLIHRDFKPDNVLVAHDGRVVVTDFGLAASIEARVAGSLRATLDGCTPILRDASTCTHTLVGTPAYMAPEQLRGDPATPASDQFAFCVSLFEIIHGVRPFAGDTVGALLHAIQRGRFVSETAVGVPRRLEATIRRGLAADPAQRFSSMQEILGALRRCATPPRRTIAAAVGAGALGLTTLAIAGPPTADPRCDLDVDPMRVAWGEDQRAAVTEAVVSARPTATAAAPRVVERIDRWTQTWTAQRNAACSGRESEASRFEAQWLCLEGRRRELEGLLDALPTSSTTDRALSTVLTMSPPQCTQPLGDAATTGRLATALADVRVLNWTSRYAEADRAAAQLVAEVASGPHAAIGAAALAEAGRARLGLGRDDEAIDLLQDAVLAASADDDDGLAAGAGAVLVMALGRAGRIDEVGLWLRHARAAAEAVDDPVVLAEIDYAAGAIAHRRRDFDEARRLFSQALQTYEQVLGHDTTRAYEVLDAFGRLEFDIGDPQAALAHFERALAIAKQVYGLEHPETATLAINIAPLLHAMGRGDEAKHLLERGLAGQRRSLGPGHVQLGTTHMQLGLLAFEAGDRAAGIEHLAACVEIHAGAPRPSPAGLTCRLNLAQALVYDHGSAAALEHYTGLGDAFASLGDGFERETAVAYLGEAYCELDRNPARADVLARQVAELLPAFGDGNFEAEVTFLRAQARWLAGHTTPETIALARRARTILDAASAPRDPELVHVGSTETLDAQIDAWLADHG